LVALLLFAISFTTAVATKTSSFIVSDNLWENSFFLQDSEGVRLDGFIGFKDVPVDSQIFAPMDGYLFPAEHEEPTMAGKVEGYYVTFTIAEDKDWRGTRSGRFITFLAHGFHLSDDAIENTELKDNLVFVRKGEFLLKTYRNIALDDIVYPDYLEETWERLDPLMKPELVVSFSQGWEILLDDSTIDIKEHVKNLIED